MMEELVAITIVTNNDDLQTEQRGEKNKLDLIKKLVG